MTPSERKALEQALTAWRNRLEGRFPNLRTATHHNRLFCRHVEIVAEPVGGWGFDDASPTVVATPDII